MFNSTFASFKVFKIHEVLKLAAIYDNATQDILYLIFSLKTRFKERRINALLAEAIKNLEVFTYQIISASLSCCGI